MDAVVLIFRLESAVEPWIEKLFDALQKHSRVEAETNKLANIAAHSLNIHSINSSEVGIL